MDLPSKSWQAVPFSRSATNRPGVWLSQLASEQPRTTASRVKSGPTGTAPVDAAEGEAAGEAAAGPTKSCRAVGTSPAAAAGDADESFGQREFMDKRPHGDAHISTESGGSMLGGV